MSLERGLENRVSTRQSHITRPLSVEAVRFFADTVLTGPGWDTDDEHALQKGKFIRTGRHIILASTVRFGRGYKELRHADIANFAYNNILAENGVIEVRQMLAAHPNLQTIDPAGLMLDAGVYLVANTADGYLLRLGGDSADFNRADSEGRQRTKDIASALLDDLVTLVVQP